VDFYINNTSMKNINKNSTSLAEQFDKQCDKPGTKKPHAYEEGFETFKVRCYA